MPSPDGGDRVVRFGVFELDLSARQLRKRGRRVPLQDKPFETLALLAARPGALVTRDELRQHLWPADTFVVFDDSLNTAVRKLRQALDDSVATPRFIETIPRYGYRFIGSIERGAAGDDGTRQVSGPAYADVRPSTGGAGQLSETPWSAREDGIAPHRPRRWTWALALVGVLGTGVALWLAARPRRIAEPPRALGLTTLPGAELYPSLSPDGSYVAFAWMDPKQPSSHVYVQMIGSGPPLRLTNDARSDYNPVWSPDGRWIAFLRADRSPPLASAPAGEAELRLIPPLGGPERVLAQIGPLKTVGSPGFLAWCPDSTCLVVTDSPGRVLPDALFAVSVASGEKRQLTHPQPPLMGDSNPAVSPDGRSLVFRRAPAASFGELYSVSLEQGVVVGGEPRRLTPGQMNGAYPAWMPNGKEIVFSSRGNLWRLAVAAGEPDGTPARIPFVGEDGLMPALSRPHAGRPTRLLYVRSINDSNIWRLSPSAAGAPFDSPPVLAISSTKGDLNPDLSPDGSRVAFASTRSGSMEIWLADLDGANAVQLTSMNAQTTAPKWSPDGRLIAFQSNRDGQFDIYVVPSAGGEPRNLTSDPANDHVPGFSGDGLSVYFGSTRCGEYCLWKVPTLGGDAVQVTKHRGFRAVESPSGDIYYTEAPVDPRRLWHMPASGGPPTRILEGVVSDAFAIVDAGVYYADRVGSETRLQFHAFATGKSTIVARSLGQIMPLLTASRDGRLVLFSRVDVSIQDLMLVDRFE